MFEWTHLPIQQEPYIAIGDSIKFKQPLDKEKIIKKFIKKYGGFDLLEKGMSTKRVKYLLGEPDEIKDNIYIYKKKDGRYLVTYSVEFDKKDGTYLRHSWKYKKK